MHVQERLAGEGTSEMRSASWPEVGLIRREVRHAEGRPLAKVYR